MVTACVSRYGARLRRQVRAYLVVGHSTVALNTAYMYSQVPALPVWLGSRARVRTWRDLLYGTSAPFSVGSYMYTCTSRNPL
eukprot:COSAG02_NODE_2318_length_9145_cov_41.373867_2_plen_82_part_00